MDNHTLKINGRYKPKDSHPDSGTFNAEKASILIIKILWNLPLSSWLLVATSILKYVLICAKEQKKMEVAIYSIWTPPTSLS